MRLNSLEIHGFKSFADKTTLDFHEGVTGIVGPNGCGKSNVVDAIRWVLGETSAKALRGGEMADVIFNGTDRRKASGMAAVTLNLIDCEDALGVDYHEVSITRRVYRDGKSEYRLNNTPCRLRDIHDLFLDTGIGRSAYSIMEQGKIDQLLSSKPEDRRAVFEEAAGISKFKKEKKEALRKLEHTSANLLRVSDVLEEQERRINALKRQVTKARRFKALSEEVKILECHLSHQEYRELLAGTNHLKQTLNSLEKGISTLEKSLPTLEETLTENRLKLAQQEKHLNAQNQALSTAQSEISTAEGQIKLNAERREDYQARIKRNESEITDNKERLTLQENDLKDTLKQITQVQDRISNQQSTLTEHKQKVEEIRKQRLELEQEEKQQERIQLATERKVASLKARLENYKMNSATTRERLEHLKVDHASLLKTLSSLQGALTTQAEKISQHKAEKKKLQEQKDQAERAFQHLRGDLDSAHAALREGQSQLAAKSSRLEILEKHLASGEGLGKGTQSVLSGLDDPAHFHPLLSDTLVKNIHTDDQYITAIEAALGSRLSAILVKDAEAAFRIIEKLTKNALGVAELLVLPLTATEKQEQLQAKPESAIGWAMDLVSIQNNKGLRNTLVTLLENTLVVPDLESAALLRPIYGDVRFVTLQGEVLTPEGFLSGGKNTGESTSTLRLQNEIKELRKEITERETQRRKAEKNIISLTSSLERASDQTERMKAAFHDHQLTLNALLSGGCFLQRVGHLK